jgi:hypothetical protein
MHAARRSRLVAIALAAVGMLAIAHAVGRSEAPAIAKSPQVAPATIAIAATPHDSDARASDVRVLTVDASGVREQAIARVAHAPTAVVRGDVLRGAAGAIVAADEEGARDRDWGAALWRVDASGARVIARGLYHASRPLASIDGAVYVERGASGADPSPDAMARGALRTDALAIDAIDPSTGASRTVYSAAGYTLHLCGEIGAELVVYFVDYGRAQILAIDRASGAARTIASVLPFARDFSIDRARHLLVMSNRDSSDSHLWAVETLDLATGSLARFYAQRDEAPAPFVLDDGQIAWTTNDRRGLSLAARTIAPYGAGFDAVTSTDGAWMTVDHVGGDFDTVAAVHVTSGFAHRLSVRDERITVLGFVGAANGGAR